MMLIQALPFIMTGVGLCIVYPADLYISHNMVW